MKSTIGIRRFRSTLMMTCLSAGIVWSGAAPGQAADTQPWNVSGKLLGKPDNDGSGNKKAEDISGIACETTAGFPRICLVADDESQGAQIVILKKGELIAGDFVRLIDDSFDGKPLELDAEGVAYADGSFYVIGSHGRPRREDGDSDAEIEARVKASSRIFRIRFAPGSIDLATGEVEGQPETTPSLDLPALVRAQAELAPFADKPLDENGLTVEGVAVRDGILYAGLRGPVPDDRRAVILSVPVGALFDGRPGETTLLRPELGPDGMGKARGVRDLATLGERLLVLAGPVNDPPEGHAIEQGDYTVFSYDDDFEMLLDLEGYGLEIKPEAVLPLDEEDGKLRALLLFDGPDEGQPTPIEIELK